ncbi:DMT family transporter [Pseudorhodoferax sp.]|uniref:DMT family transporter n=1 Tax=Pseudorhodoferax sp. TaxID=1993553 RepID=UPI0039E22182
MRPGLGIALTVLATLCFAALDTVSQYLGPAVPVLMMVWLRYLTQAGLTAALLLPQHGRALLRTRAPHWQLLRALLMVTSNTLAFLSLRHVPVGEFTAVMMLAPLAVTVLAALLLGERVRPVGWALVAGGLLGALLVVRPRGGGFQAALLLPLLLVLANAGYQVVTSRMVRTEHPGTTHFYTGLIGLACCTLALPWGWAPMAEGRLWALAALVGALGSVGHYLLIRAYSLAPAARLTPFLYCQVGFATLAGWLAFGHRPDGWAWLGIGLIALCGWLGARRRG